MKITTVFRVRLSYSLFVSLLSLGMLNPSQSIADEKYQEELNWSSDCTVSVIDNEDSGFSEIGANWNVDTRWGYEGSVSEINTTGRGEPLAAVEWTQSGLAPGDYSVAVTYPILWDTATTVVPFEVYDGATLLGTYMVDQDQTPTDFFENGVGWRRLGVSHSVTSGTLTVRLTNDVPTGRAAWADAVRFQRDMEFTNDGPVGFLAENSLMPPSTTACPPPPTECPYYSVRSCEQETGTCVDADDELGWDAWATPFVKTTNVSAEGDSCLRSAIESAAEFCEGQGENTNDFDSCIVRTFMNPTYFAGQTLPHNLHCGTNVATSHLVGMIYFDDTCNAVCPDTPPDSSEVCHVATIYYNTPISFLWDQGSNDAQAYTFSSFPLDPTGKSRIHVWKGSAERPLLVYDPKHTGKITSAAQLFGNWTFGGKELARLGAGSTSVAAMGAQLASLGASSMSTDTAGDSNKWENGFEALAFLDSNKDGEVSGKELMPLGIWFDKNRDGVSQVGEVKTLAEVGVHTLYYTPDRHDPATKSIYATLGYERTLNGSEVSGGLVDWFAEGAATQTELIGKVRAKRIFDELPVASKKQTQEVIDQISKESAISVGKTYSATGAWTWQVTEGSRLMGSQGGGTLVLEQIEDGKVRGVSLVEVPFKQEARWFRSTATSHRVSGEVSIDGERRLEISFDVVTDKGAIAKTIATLSPNGDTLSGVTEEMIVEDAPPVRYHWTATRMGPTAKSEK